MNDLATADSYGVLTEPTTLVIQRHLPGPIERVWSYLTDSDLRSQWLAAGVMEMKVGSPVELVWHNDNLTNPPGNRPPEFPEDHRMQSRIVQLDPPRKLCIAWGDGDVTFDLAPAGDRVLLTLTHRGLVTRGGRLMVGAGWHMHLNILVARISGTETEPFWDGWARLRNDYDSMLPV
jgi:uncharacterized protein YndB with AHSA1/START domain